MVSSGDRGGRQFVVKELVVSDDCIMRNDVEDCSRATFDWPGEFVGPSPDQTEALVDESGRYLRRVLVASDSEVPLSEILVIVVQFRPESFTVPDIYLPAVLVDERLRDIGDWFLIPCDCSVRDVDEGVVVPGVASGFVEVLLQL